jgi:Flp pilus assembly protein TadD
MFRLFGKKVFRPTVTQDDKDWIEMNIISLIKSYGFERLKEAPFIFPTEENFPYTNFKDEYQFQKLFEQLCNYWDLDHNWISVNFFEDVQSKEWETLIPQGSSNEPAWSYSQFYKKDEKRFEIQLAKSDLDNPGLLISVMARILASVKSTVSNHYIIQNSPDIRPYRDLTCIFFGFGILFANTVWAKKPYWTIHSGALPNQVISYTNALICYVTEQNVGNCESFLNSNTKDLFKKDYEFLNNTGNTLLTKDKISESDVIFKLRKQVSDGLHGGGYEKAIEAGRKLISLDPKDSSALNNVGYAFLHQRKYNEAIAEFTKAIEVHPNNAFPYNNRGYCKLQIGEFADAFSDIQYSLDMNQGNSYAWRNMGAYYLKINEFAKALSYFEKAEKMNPTTEMINFYLGEVYLKLGNMELSKKYLDKSKDLNEHNDSMIE